MTDRLPAEWDVSEAELIAETKTSRIFRVRHAGAGTAVVKDLKPIGMEDELRGADYLAWRDGLGAVRLVARHGSTLLLEDAGDLTLLHHLDSHGDAAATAIFADVLRKLHAPADLPPPAVLHPLRDWFGSLFELARVSHDPLIARGAHTADALLGDQHDVRPLHGDLHHENILHAPRGWLAIDPKGLVGDAAYDSGNAFYNPLGRDDLRLDPDRIVGMAEALAAALDREPSTVLRWGLAHACLSASWHLEDGSAEKASRSLGVAAAIASVLDGPPPGPGGRR